mgnify:CR=1 FL=1
MSDKQQMLDKVDAAIEAILDGGAVQSYMINGRRIDRMTLSELTGLRDKLQNEISAGTNRRTFAKFTEPT